MWVLTREPNGDVLMWETTKGKYYTLPQRWSGLLLDGVDFRKLELRWLRRQIGLVEQEPVRGCDARLEHKGWVARLGLSHSSPRFPLYRCSST